MEDQERQTDIGIFIQHPPSEKKIIYYNIVKYPLALLWFIRHIFGALNRIEFRDELLPNIWNNINLEAGIVLLADLSACPTFCVRISQTSGGADFNESHSSIVYPFGFSFS